MRAMVLERVGCPLVLKHLPMPILGPYDVLIKIQACGVCRTDLHIIDGELLQPKLPLVPGHQVVGRIEALGKKVTKHHLENRVGVPWLGETCHACEFCLSERENLCDHAIYTGYLRDGGYADYCTAHEDYIIPLPPLYDDLHIAPLLCAGLIGFRGLRLVSEAQKIGFYGFGSSAHLLIQVAKSLGREIYVFTRPNDQESQDFALSLGAIWAGGSDDSPPTLMDAALIFAPVGELCPQALKSIKKGGKVISVGIHMSDLPSFPYSLLWQERSISSVANLTRKDAIDFFELIEKIPLQVAILPFPLEKANLALETLRRGKVHGSIVLSMD
ncbi:putative alcohol dehydrogenase AdhA [Chlamydiales bacterium STE3]|nr:putative alcohol dehydrogenase AdhA [Chlamydiales bacterium STE3]